MLTVSTSPERSQADSLFASSHEFDFTPSVTRARIAEAEFPMLSNNAVEPDGAPIDGVTEHLLLDVGRYKVACSASQPRPWR